MTETELIKKFNRREKDALDIIVLEFYPILVQFVIRIVFDQSEAEDIAIQSLTTLITDKENYTFNNMKALKGCIYKIARNKALDYLKAQAIKNDRQKEYAFLLQQNHVSTLDNATDYEERQAELFESIKKEIDRHSPRQKEAFTLYYLQKLPVRDIAIIMNISESKVYEYKDIVLRNLKRVFSNQFDKLRP